jgi:hypothetical protein
VGDSQHELFRAQFDLPIPSKSEALDMSELNHFVFPREAFVADSQLL